MRFVSGLFGLLILVSDAVQVVHSQNLSPRGRVIRLREGSRREPMVTDINQKMNSHQRQRRIKGEKEEKNEDEGAKKKGKGKPDDEEVPPKDVIEGDDDDDDEEKDLKLPKGGKGQAKEEKEGTKGAKKEKEGTKGAKKEKAKEKKEEMKESDKIVKGASTIPPLTEDSVAPASSPSNTITSKPSTAAEETTSPAPTISPTCVECDDLGR
ncbi:hypothetical protein MHU86_8797 [Fragilaria crotonensis]|nr:hypothetical protein MHU86_8797 [Fragilaria crotonensis]